MAGAKSPKRGDVYWINPNASSGQEMKGGHRFIIITPYEINSLGISMAVPVVTTGGFAQKMGLTVPVATNKTEGVAVCNQVRSFDIQSRVQMEAARYIESLDSDVVSEIVNRVLSVIEPAPAL